MALKQSGQIYTIKINHYFVPTTTSSKEQQQQHSQLLVYFVSTTQSRVGDYLSLSRIADFDLIARHTSAARRQHRLHQAGGADISKLPCNLLKFNLFWSTWGGWAGGGGGCLKLPRKVGGGDGGDTRRCTSTNSTLATLLQLLLLLMRTPLNL